MANITLDDLATMIGKGFNEMNERFEKQDQKIAELRTELKGDIENLRIELTDEMQRQFSLVHKRIDDLSKTGIFRDEFEALEHDVRQLQLRGV